MNINLQFEGYWGGEFDFGLVQLCIEIILEEMDGSWSGEFVFVDQGNVCVFVICVIVENDCVIVDFLVVGVCYEVEFLFGGILDGEFYQVGQVFELDMSVLVVDMDLEFVVIFDDCDQEFSVSNGDVIFVGVLCLLEGDGLFFVVVIISGFGFQDCDMMVGEYCVFVMFVVYLVDVGFVILCFDDCGVGGSDVVILYYFQVIVDDMGVVFDVLCFYLFIQG